MTNNAFHRLLNEWMFNQYNDLLLDYLKNRGIKYDSILRRSSDIEMAKEARSALKKTGIWLEDTCEEDMYIDLMPMGGYTDYTELKAEIKKYREKQRRYR